MNNKSITKSLYIWKNLQLIYLILAIFLMALIDGYSTTFRKGE